LSPSGSDYTSSVGQGDCGWWVVLPGVTVHGDAETFDGGIDDLIDGLREYAEDWNTRLHRAPKHQQQQQRSIVERVELSDDEQLRDWLLSRDTTLSAQTQCAAAGGAVVPLP
jgi:hypothetical protein